MADVLVGFCAGVREGDLVTLESSTLAAPLLRELYGRVLEAGAQPLPRMALEPLTENLFMYVRRGRLGTTARPNRCATATSSARPPVSSAGC